MNEEYDPKKESFSDYQQRIIGEYMAMNMDKSISNYLIHNIKTPKILLFFENIFLLIKNIFITMKSKILDFISEHTNTITIRPAGSMITIAESMSQSVKLKNLKQFAEWVYDNWAAFDNNFNWNYLNTWCYDEKPDNRVGWRKTYIITISYSSHNGSYPIAFTDKPFYELKSKCSDNIEIIHKYPKLLQCVSEIKTGTRDESELYRKHQLNIFEQIRSAL
jgi:hypothetical protein